MTLEATFNQATGTVVGKPKLGAPVGIFSSTANSLAASLNLTKVNDTKIGWAESRAYMLIVHQQTAWVTTQPYTDIRGNPVLGQKALGWTRFTLLKKGTYNLTVLSVLNGVVDLGFAVNVGAEMNGVSYMGLAPSREHFGYVDYGFGHFGMASWEPAGATSIREKTDEVKENKTAFDEGYQVIWSR